MQRAGNASAQYEYPSLFTAAKRNEMRYPQAPRPISNLFDTLCCKRAAVAFARMPQTTIGSMCTPVEREPKPWTFWKKRAIQNAKMGKPMKPSVTMRSNYVSVSQTPCCRSLGEYTLAKSLDLSISSCRSLRMGTWSPKPEMLQ
jgi:hypothetical protein